MNDEVYRILFVSTPPLLLNKSSDTGGWWYLRILRWMKMSVLRDFLMRWFYEPIEGGFSYVYYMTAYAEPQPQEVLRLRFVSNDEAVRMVI